MIHELGDLQGADLNGISLRKQIGEGGMGEVWLGHDIALDVPVAVKVLPARLAADKSFVARFIREARAIARVDHPNVIRIFQAGRRSYGDLELRVLVMEFVKGVDLRELLDTTSQGKLSFEQASAIILQTALGLRAAHRLGIVHRDIKPANIMLADEGEQVKLLDFGIARGKDPRLETFIDPEEESQRVVGTPLYMAPEQARGKVVSAAADVYALGLTFFELLSGEHPFGAFFGNALIMAKCKDGVDFTKLPVLDAPKEVVELICGMCATNPIDRPPIEEVVRVLRSSDSEHKDEVEPLSKTVAVRSSTFAPQGSMFIGRDMALEQVQAIVDEGARLVTILGPAGVGKTRLAQEFAHMQRERFSGGIYFCDLTEARTMDSMCIELAKALGLIVKGDPATLVRDALKARKNSTLVILDNFEQLQALSEESVADWLSISSKLTLLVSSRAPLHVQGEETFLLAPLSLAGSSANEESAALLLFVDRAKKANHGFELDAQSAQDVQELCVKLEGIPLAIELAAARCSVFKPRDILKRMSRRFDLLRIKTKGKVARQQTLRDAIAWSWDMLEPFEKAALSQCTMFRGGCLLDAAEAVIDVSEYEDAPFEIDILENLVEKSLLVASEVPELPGEIRYRMLESMREFVLEAMQPRDSDHRRHAEYFLSYAEQWSTQGRGVSGAEALRRIHLELANLFQIQDRFGAENPELGARAILAAWISLHNAGPSSEMMPRLEKALKSCGAGEILLRADLLQRMVRTHTDYGDINLAEGFGQESIALLQEHRNELGGETCAKGELEAWFALGVLYTHLNREVDAIAAFEKAEKAARISKDQSGLAKVLTNRGILLRETHQGEQAIALHLQAEAIYRELGDDSGLAVNTISRGAVSLDKSDIDQAARCADSAEKLFRARGNLKGLSISLAVRAEVRLHKGDLPSALEASEESYEVAKALGFDRSFESFRVLALAAISAFRMWQSFQTKEYLEVAESRAKEARKLGEAFGLARLISAGSKHGETHRFWQWIDEVLPQKQG